MVIELRVVQFWSEIILVISNRTRAARSFDFEITRIISDQIVLHSVQLPLLIKRLSQFKTSCFYFALMASYLSCTIDEPWILKLIEARHVSNWHCTFKSYFKKICLVLTCFSIFGSLSDFNNGSISSYYQLRFWAATFFADIWS